jgi:hypothetical protein
MMSVSLLFIMFSCAVQGCAHRLVSRLNVADDTTLAQDQTPARSSCPRNSYSAAAILGGLQQGVSKLTRALAKVL